MIRHFTKQYFVLILSLLGLAVLMDWIYQQQQSRKGAIYLEQIAQYIDQNSDSLSIPITQLELEDLELTPDQLKAIKAGSPIILDHLSGNQENQYILSKVTQDLNDSYILLGPLKGIKHSHFAIIFYLGITAILIFWLTYFFNGLLKLKKSANEFSETLDESAFEKHWRTGLDPIFNALKKMAIRNKTLIEVQKDINSTLSHEIRTPLMKLGFKAKLLNPNNIEEQKSAIKKDLDQINSIVTEMLNYAKSDANLPHLDIFELDIGALLMNIVNELSITHSKVISVEVCQGTLLADQTSLSRAFENLLTNSIKYSHSKIHVSSDMSDLYYKVTIEDDGPGIKNKSDSLEPFNRCNLEDENGFGLGLSIANKAIEWNGGKLLFDRSTTLGGAKISLIFRRNHFSHQD